MAKTSSSDVAKRAEKGLLPKTRRLRHKADFDKVFKTGRIIDRPRLRIIWARGHGRAAVVAAKAIGSLAHRNRVRRRWREAMRLLVDSIPHEVDLVAVVKPDGAGIRGREVVNELQDALRQIEKI